MAGDLVTQPGAGVQEPQPGRVLSHEEMLRLAEVANPAKQPIVQLEIDALARAVEHNAFTAVELIDRIQPVSQQFDPPEKVAELPGEPAATGVPLVDRIHELTVMIDKTTAGLRRALAKLEL